MSFFQDHFLDNRNEWPIRNDWQVSMMLGAGDYTYVIDRRVEDGHSIAWKDIEMPASIAFKVHTVLQRESGGNHGYGLIWRGEDRENCWALEIAASGYFKIKKRVNGIWSSEIDWQPCPAVRRNQGPDELLVEQLPQKARLFVNNELVYELDQPSPAHNRGFGYVVNGKQKIRVTSGIVMEHVPAPEEEAEAAASAAEALEEVLADLDAFIGMNNIKQEIRTLVNVLKVQKLRLEREMKTTSLSLHMVLAGPPGTGKTSVARLIGRIYMALGFLKKGHVVETDRAGLVASYVGQTAPKVDEKVKEALGGILFIDEAYALMPGEADGRDFGREAIETLLKRMEDYRDQFALVIAGYGDQMHRFLDANPGVRSRFNRYLYFEHYNPEELTLIFEKFCRDGGYELTEGARMKLRVHMAQAYARRDRTFGNGRYARNLFEKVIENQANRIVAQEPMTDETLVTFTELDLPLFTDFELNDPRPEPGDLSLAPPEESSPE